MAARHPPCRALKPKEKDYKVTDRDGMYVHVTAKGAMSFRMDCQPMSYLRSTMQPSRPSRNGHPISSAFRFRSGAMENPPKGRRSGGPAASGGSLSFRHPFQGRKPKIMAAMHEAFGRLAKVRSLV